MSLEIEEVTVIEITMTNSTIDTIETLAGEETETIVMTVIVEMDLEAAVSTEGHNDHLMSKRVVTTVMNQTHKIVMILKSQLGVKMKENNLTNRVQTIEAVIKTPISMSIMINLIEVARETKADLLIKKIQGTKTAMTALDTIIKKMSTTIHLTAETLKMTDATIVELKNLTRPIQLISNNRITLANALVHLRKTLVNKKKLLITAENTPKIKTIGTVTETLETGIEEQTLMIDKALETEKMIAVTTHHAIKTDLTETSALLIEILAVIGHTTMTEEIEIRVNLLVIARGLLATIVVVIGSRLLIEIQKTISTLH